jgi:hypothetical protein
METLAERIKTLEDKVSILESGSFGALKVKEEPGKPYETKPSESKMVIVRGIPGPK